jgi:hypothetical protein
MNIILKNIKELPDAANAAFWRETIGCSKLTMDRAEKKGALVPSGTKAHKLYMKTNILKWLGVE